MLRSDNRDHLEKAINHLHQGILLSLNEDLQELLRAHSTTERKYKYYQIQYKSIIDDMNLGNNSEVEIEVSEGSIKLHPIKKKEYSLEELMDGVTRENIHHEVETGPSKGNETW